MQNINKQLEDLVPYHKIIKDKLNKHGSEDCEYFNEEEVINYSSHNKSLNKNKKKKKETILTKPVTRKKKYSPEKLNIEDVNNNNNNDESVNHENDYNIGVEQFSSSSDSDLSILKEINKADKSEYEKQIENSSQNYYNNNNINYTPNRNYIFPNQNGFMFNQPSQPSFNNNIQYSPIQTNFSQSFIPHNPNFSNMGNMNITNSNYNPFHLYHNPSNYNNTFVNTSNQFDQNINSIDPLSCPNCETIYQLTIFNNVALSMVRCIYCNNITNLYSLEFYLEKYRKELHQKKERRNNKILNNESTEIVKDLSGRKNNPKASISEQKTIFPSSKLNNNKQVKDVKTLSSINNNKNKTINHINTSKTSDPEENKFKSTTKSLEGKQEKESYISNLSEEKIDIDMEEEFIKKIKMNYETNNILVDEKYIANLPNNIDDDKFNLDNLNKVSDNDEENKEKFQQTYKKVYVITYFYLFRMK